MKKLNRIIAALLIAVSLLALAACAKFDPDAPIEGLIEIQPQYVGEKVYDTQHEFKKSDFELTAVYEGTKSEKVTNFTWECIGMSTGVYVITFKYGGITNDLYVNCEMNFYAD